jgi:hypothetical protein
VAAASLILAGCGGTLSRGGDGTGRGGASGPGGRGGSAVGGAIGLGGAPWQCGSTNNPIPAVLPPDLLFVLDASAAMNDDISGAACSGGCGASSKWAQAAAAIERLAADWDAVANMGLEIFPDSGSVCGAGRGVAVPVGPAHATAITAAISARTSANGGVLTDGNAPIRSAVEGAMSHLTRLTDPGSKNILLATAGAPNCLPGSDAGADDSAGSVQAIRNAATAGIRTTVLGIVTPGGTADVTLNEMASAGGGMGPGWPPYTPVGNLAALMTTLETLLGLNPPCTFSLPPAPTNDGTTTRSNIGVSLDGTPIPQDPNHLNGWDYLDASQSSIQLYGPACQALAGPPHTLSIVFRCLLQ